MTDSIEASAPAWRKAWRRGVVRSLSKLAERPTALMTTVLCIDAPVRAEREVYRQAALRTMAAMAKLPSKSRRPPPQPAPPRRSFIERPSTAVLFMVSVFVGGLAIGAIIAKLRPPT